QPPSMTGSSAETITLPGTLTLTVSAADDGIPKPRVRRNSAGANADSNTTPATRSRREQGLLIKWILFRESGKVRFDPDTSPDALGKPVTLTSKGSFSSPGTYVLQAMARGGLICLI